MPNEEEKMFKIIKTGAFTLFMLTIGVLLSPEWTIITLLCLIYLKED